MRLALLKAIGTFASLAVIIPIRCQNFFKDLLESGLIKEICSIFADFDETSSKNVTPVNMAAAEVLSTLICPVYGDFYSFPWKRGPHDNIMDFVEVSPIFEKLREKVF